MQLNHEKRQTNRIPLEIPIQIGDEQGISKDISFSGIYFTTRKPFEPGENLQFVFELEFAAPGKGMLLDCQGYIIRVEKIEEEYGIAATIEDVTYLH